MQQLHVTPLHYHTLFIALTMLHPLIPIFCPLPAQLKFRARAVDNILDCILSTISFGLYPPRLERYLKQQQKIQANQIVILGLIWKYNRILEKNTRHKYLLVMRNQIILFISSYCLVEFNYLPQYHNH